MKLSIPTLARLRGNTMVLTVVTIGLVTFVLLAYLTLVKNQHLSVARSQAWNAAIPIIEAGIEDALTHLNTHGITNLACDGWTQVGSLYFRRHDIGDGFYVCIISNWTVGGSNTVPVIDSRGFVYTTLLAARQVDWLLAAAGSGFPSSGYLVRGVRVRTKPQGLFTKAMVAKSTITFYGSVRTDSFDSTDPAWSTDGRYDPNKFRDNGDVASNEQIINAVKLLGNVKVYGRVATGPKGTVRFTGNAAAGSKAWINAGNTGIQPGWFRDDMNVNFPDVPVPFSTEEGSRYYSWQGTNYYLVLTDGKYRWVGDLSLKREQTIMVVGNARLYVTGNFDLGSKGRVIIAPGASLELTVGGSIGLTGQGVVNQNGNARHCRVYGLPTCTSITMSGNAEFCGVIYAPNAAMSLDGGGSSPVDFVGACIVGSVNMGGSYNFHYDESLANWGPIKGFVVTSWDEMPPQQAAALPPEVAAALFNPQL